MIIGVIGNSECLKDIYDVSYMVGKEIALSGNILINGGRGGVMEASAKGAHDVGGLVIGVLPWDRSDANSYIKIPIVAGIGECRNIIIVKSSDAIIAIDGSYGTLSEIAFALKFDVPIVGINTWDLKSNSGTCPYIPKVEDPKEAVKLAIKLSKKDGEMKNW
ncbi:MAG TPA: TIGR00725 family protein [Candidatus Atribacteria bacterium]|nr:TIGR00725 family protein [Candidatus Atribacteria bacterium]